MAHYFFTSVMLVIFLMGMSVQWRYRGYLQLLVLVHSVEISFMGIIGWYSFGELVLLPLFGLWLLGTLAIFVMNQYAD